MARSGKIWDSTNNKIVERKFHVDKVYNKERDINNVPFTGDTLPNPPPKDHAKKVKKFRDKRCWRKVSKLVLDRDPLCLLCPPERKRPSQQAHHIIPLAVDFDFDYALDIENNLVGLCSRCHTFITLCEVKKGITAAQEYLEENSTDLFEGSEQ